jgi:hypothetical protein
VFVSPKIKNAFESRQRSCAFDLTYILNGRLLRENQMQKEDQTTPKARKERILVQELSDEVLVYDLDNHKAHCLNKAAAAVWEHCDGTKSIRDIALAAGSDLNAQADESMVFYALDQLGKAGLLEKRIPVPDGKPKLSRRELMRKAGVAAMIAIPVVTSILAPKSLASATSCGSPCTPASAECVAILNCTFCPSSGPNTGRCAAF